MTVKDTENKISKKEVKNRDYRFPELFIGKTKNKFYLFIRMEVVYYEKIFQNNACIIYRSVNSSEQYHRGFDSSWGGN
ncbi:hypothetical protein RF007C_12705 [Ruminococcus flavefaciens 007c]|uniref:Uncharacterized protein n=1 Tax=Ruminococcus flavefaciens 007c TaxID=1341157 RepID=W7UTT0_RUMFL|nr:hypothetical protein RF007C_12705 [Ruminococcus flavefaciens 007c]